ncbi:MAG: DpnII family type II restriction endonuclease [Candidatus Zophobacter franzmannii]|jgi:type II restriction enzyme|nr:DpnII family type II restriction endonuclease [Candidatus Zophobacter franzmannii]
MIKNAFQLESFFETPEKIIEFIENSGLSELFQNSNVKNLEDYVFGVEVGLDTNARKNRSGKNFEILIGMVFNDRGIEYQEQVVVGNPIVVEALGVDRKLFDFVVNGKDCTYLIEVNFYNGGGSKLNEVARSYTDLASKINKIDGYEFVWITDGEGWKSAKNKLEEAYNSIPKVYNISSIDEFIRILRV